MTDQNTLKIIVTDPNGASQLVKEANDLGESLAKPPNRQPPLTTSQIRSIYGEMLRIKADWLESRDDDPAGARRKARAKRALILMKPKMAYRARKEKGPGVRQLVDVLVPAIDLVQGDDGNFRRFTEFFEAILAYHRAHGGN